MTERNEETEKTRAEKTREVYNKIAPEYAKNQEDELSSDEREKFTNLLDPGSGILSVGCGHGRDEKRFKKDGFQPVGVDFSEELLKIARKQNPDIPFFLRDMRSLQFQDESFEGVWAHKSLHHLERGDMPEALGEFYRVLTPGGVLFVLTRLGEGDVTVREAMSSGQEREYTLLQPGELDGLLTQSGFEQIELYTFNEKERGGRDLEWISAFYKKPL